MPAYSACSTTPTGSNATFNPNDPAASGYELVFDEEFNDLSHISFQAPSAVTSGYNFYSSNLVGCGIKPSSQFSLNRDGSLHDSGYNGGCGYDLSSVGYAPGKSAGTAAWQMGWVGHAFGQGYYQEARIKFVKACDSSTHGFAFPTIWSDPVEAEAQNSAPGNMAHFVELDEMEWLCGTPSIYYNNSHDWWNNMTGHIQISNNITSPAGTNFSQWHVWGQLWVYGGAPGSCATGYRQAYFDGVPAGNKITWQDCSNAYPPVAPNIGNMIDNEHLSTNIGTGPASPMDIDWVHVWQLPAAASASGNSAIMPQANFTGGTGSCAAASLPDVIVTSLSYNTSTGLFTSVVKNQGAAATPAGVVVGVSYQVDGVPQTWGNVMGPLAAGASVTIGDLGGAYTIPNGTHTITAYVNDVNRFAESNITNNKLSQTITIGGSPLPDVIVISLSYDTSTGLFTSVVKNQGTAATPAGVVVGVSYQVDGVPQTWGNVMGPLAAGASVTIGDQGGAYTIPNGTHTITAYVNDVNRFAESNITNNKLSQTITIGSS
jgi:hypothetical protein